MVASDDGGWQSISLSRLRRAPARPSDDQGERERTEGLGSVARGLSVEVAGRAPTRDPRRRRWHENPRAIVPARQYEARRAPPGSHLLPRRITAADAARIQLFDLLSQRLRA